MSNLRAKAETALIKHLITRTHPTGIISLVCDTFDFWGVIEYSLPKLKNIILGRNGKCVIRPDSGDPVLIVCGDPNGKTELERKGAIEALWDIFGGTVSKQGYKVLDPHIGLIYGDAITLLRCEEICQRLKDKGFASINVVFGIGSYTYQYNTRDTFGNALKSTWVKINGKGKMIFKDPKTDNGIKKSQKGRVAVIKTSDGIQTIDCLEEGMIVSNDLMRVIFKDGVQYNITDLDIVRQRLAGRYHF